MRILCAGGAVFIFILIAIGVFIKKKAVVFVTMDDVYLETDTVDASWDDMKLRNSREYRTWKNTSDTTFLSLYNGSRSADILQSHPKMVVLWAGSSFSKAYASPRGHMYSITDIRRSLRSGAPRGKEDGPLYASCWACKSQDAPHLLETMGEGGFYKKKWASFGNEIVNPVGCADCHEPGNMSLRISRPYLTDAYSRRGKSVEDASEQEMRSLVCAQCHSEYYFKGEDKIVTFPWDKGLAMEDIEAYYDSLGYTDYLHKLSKAPLLKAQHPDFELSRMGIHARRGVSCGECHMPYEGEGDRGYNNHHIRSPLAMVDRTCQSCHRESKSALMQDVYDRQAKVEEARERVEDELARAHIEAEFAWNRGVSALQMEPVLQLLRQAQWRWDFVVASHGSSFHAPQEAQRILGSGLDKAMQARLLLARILMKSGYRQEVPMPDLSTKEKAQLYIGLDMAGEEAGKKAFLETVIPEWEKEAKENGRYIEDGN